MSRYRVPIVVAVVVVFAAVAGYLIFANRTPGGQSLTFNLTITGAKTMSPSDLSAHLNDTITTNITSDTDGEVHLHGYDIHFDTKAGQTVRPSRQTRPAISRWSGRTRARTWATWW